MKNNKAKVNYQKKLEDIIGEIELREDSGAAKKPRLLLQACCAPCSSYVLEYISSIFDLDIYFYNPNIFLEDEFDKRAEEFKKLSIRFYEESNLKVIKPEYDAEEFYAATKGLEDELEGGNRCTKCYKLRLEKTAEYAAQNSYDFFGTTLSTSPHKDVNRINQIGAKLEEVYGIRFLYSDFKKKNGYKRSVDLSKELGLYRQDYCGCVYSRDARLKLDKHK